MKKLLHLKMIKKRPISKPKATERTIILNETDGITIISNFLFGITVEHIDLMPCTRTRAKPGSTESSKRMLLLKTLLGH